MEICDGKCVCVVATDRRLSRSHCLAQGLMHDVLAMCTIWAKAKVARGWRVVALRNFEVVCGVCGGYPGAGIYLEANKMARAS